MRKILLFAGAGMAGLLFTFLQPAFGENEYQFDLSEIEKEIEKKPYHIGGFLEFSPVIFGLDRNASLYHIKISGNEQGATQEQYNFGLRLEGSCQKGIGSLFFRLDNRLWHNYQGWDGDVVLLEGYLSLKPGPSLTVNTGKEVVQWGKGYAFNPVAFVSRPKDPNDPTEALEGYSVVTADMIKSFEGPLKTLAFTPVILPVTDSINDDFGRVDHINFAAKLYFLFWDTDMDLLFFTGESRSTRFGFDFSKNIKTNFEIHGEMAWITDYDKKSVDSQGNLFTENSDIIRALLGIRYLTTNDITFTIEYYYNGGGIDADGARNFYRLVDRAYDTFLLSSGDSSQLDHAAKLSQDTLATTKPMRDYLYFRASWKEPFDILYFTPAVSSIVNLNDHSLSLTPEVLYSPITNLEFRLRTAFLMGAKHTEYGEKINDYKIEFRVRYYF